MRHLRVVATIAETGSLTKAAAALRLSQPGLSAQLRRIEQLLGGRLFDRGSNGVVRARTRSPAGCGSARSPRRCSAG